MTDREPKKTETLEVRVSHETKTAFMATCAANGVSASKVLRGFIAGHIAATDRAPPRWKEFAMLTHHLRRRPTLTLAGAALFSAIATIALVAPAKAAIDPRVTAAFDWMDANHDGDIDAAEFSGADDASPASDTIVIELTNTMPSVPNETRDALFARLDTDRNGTLTAAELARGTSVSVTVSPAVVAADANRDGRIGEAELAAHLAADRARAGAPDASAGVGLMAHAIVVTNHPDENGTVALADLARLRTP
ncbi:EF hand domain-containing protein [Hephaestia caeni]|uniref:EF hand domain-containing protein n=1 Tax=Hephaestia caeni TaxID=645617 RepID=A0A397PC26_9SPHN|nr:EF-hand domain-containing protein [Hephaestia caeni]RIA47120.1 EF hand domain-containing protein [Hephaestia caeni]